MKKRVTIDFDEETYIRFKFYCKNNGLKISTTLENMMKEEFEQVHMKKNYDKFFKMFEEMMSHRMHSPSLSGAILMPENKTNEQIVKESKMMHENTNKINNNNNESGHKKKIPTLDELRYKRGF